MTKQDDKIKTIRITEKTHTKLLNSQLEVNLACEGRLNLSEVIDFLCEYYKVGERGVKRNDEM